MNQKRIADPFYNFVSDLIKKSADALNKRLKRQKLQTIVCHPARLRAMHGGDVLNVLLDRCHSAHILIFDITQRNANVMFELGIGLATKGLDGRVFIFQKYQAGDESTQKPPSDLSGYFITRYTETTKGGKKHYTLVDWRGFDAALQSRIREAARSLGYRVDRL